MLNFKGGPFLFCYCMNPGHGTLLFLTSSTGELRSYVMVKW